MKSQSGLSMRLLLIAGIIEIIAGLLHFAMPHFAYQAKGFSFLDQNEESFVTAGVFSVGILLIAFGALTAYLSLEKDTPTKMLLCYVTIKSVLWLARIAIEILYPVKVPLFLIRQPTVLLLPFFILEWLLFVIVAILVCKSSSNKGLQRIAEKAGSR